MQHNDAFLTWLFHLTLYYILLYCTVPGKDDIATSESGYPFLLIKYQAVPH